MIKYEIAIKIPSLNDVINKSRTHNKAGAALKKAVEDDICWQIKQQGVKKAKHPVDIHLTFFEGNKKRDKDNVISTGMKFGLDSLVRMKVLQGDGFDHINQIYPKVYVSDNKKYWIEIEIREKGEIKC